MGELHGHAQRRLLLPVICAALTSCSFNVVSAAGPVYDKDIAPILKRKCARCHSGEDAEAEFDLSMPAALLKGGESGEVIVPGRPEASRLLEVVRAGEMPPPGEGTVSRKEQTLLEEWIKNGAVTGSGSDNRPVALTQVLPILQLRCVVCHGARRRQGDLDLRTRETILKGGKTGPAVVLGKPDESLLLKRIHAGDMPPKKDLVRAAVKPMEAIEVATITRWIRQGATAARPEPFDPESLVSDEDREFRFFQTAVRPDIPEVADVELVRNPIDRFIQARLAQKKLSLSPEADAATLMRRLYFDLTGLPPSPEDIDQFLQDESIDAWERLVDRTLASPHYGERWGSYWLDLAGYSDSDGISHSDPVRPHVWRYRDYVIRSFNADKSYARFLTEQLAGDELTDFEKLPTIDEETYANLVATGFLRMPEDGSFAGITAFVPDRLEVIDDTLEVFSSAVLGLTVRCARCHDHKLEPIPQADYYRLAAVFKGALDENDWLNPQNPVVNRVEGPRLLPHVTTEERSAWERQKREIDDGISAARKALDEARERRIDHVRKIEMAKLPDDVRAAVRNMLKTPAKKRTAEQKSLATKYEAGLKFSDEALVEKDEEFKQGKQRHDSRVAEFEARRQPEPFIRALWDRGSPSPTYILKRGNYLTPGAPVESGAPTVLSRVGSPYDLKKHDTESSRTGRRLELARWLTQPTHPLTARVIVNRVWRHHFHRGIVKSLDNFGKSGTGASHPELLDWLASEFVRQGWSIKALHRLILTSATYRQQSTVSEKTYRFDPDNELYSRMPLRRLEAETLRDTLLHVAGRLNDRPFGPADPVSMRADGLVTSKPINGVWRRSMYVLHRRTERLTMFDNFDRPRMSPNCVDRSDSTVAPQALQLLNSALVRELAESLAKRIQSEFPADTDAQINRLYEITLARRPDSQELNSARSALASLSDRLTDGKPDAAEKQPLINLSHAVMNSAAFLYVD